MSANSYNFISFFPIWISFISFFFTIALVKTSSAMLNSSGERKHPCLLDLKSNVFTHLLLRMMLAVCCSYVCACSVSQSLPTLCNPKDCSPQAPLHEILQARILKWIVIFSQESSWPRDKTHVTCIVRQSLYHWATWGS